MIAGSRRLVLCILCCVCATAGAGVVLCTLGPTGADAYNVGVWKWAEGECWQTGHFGVSSMTCGHATEPHYLATHMINDENRVEKFKQPSGLYCSYFGLPLPINKAEPYKEFPTTPAPSEDYLEGDLKGNVCGVWAATFVTWGFNLESGPEHACTGEGEERRACGMERYLSLAGQGFSDRPWASTFGEPILDFSTTPHLLIPPEWGWGYECAMVEEVHTEAILELCKESWRGTIGPHESTLREAGEWSTGGGVFVLECHAATPEFKHSVDRVALAEFEGGITARELDNIVTMDDRAFVAKAEGGRNNEPDIGDGCGRASSAKASEWALIGTSVGIEQWKSVQTLEYAEEGAIQTVFEPVPPTISSEFSAETKPEAPEQATLTGTIDPNGVPTDYVVEYGRYNPAEHSTAETLVGGQETSPVEVKSTLTALLPSTTYRYRIKAFHPVGYYEESSINGIAYGEEQTFTTPTRQCAGSNIVVAGSTLQDIAQVGVWDPQFDKSKNAAACGGTQGGGGSPTISYESIGSGAGLEDWGYRGHKFEGLIAVVATDEPVNETEKREIEGNEISKGSAPESVQSIPVLQAAVAIVVHLPANCTASNTASKSPFPGRLVLGNVTLQKIWDGEITKWSQIADSGDRLTGTGCNPETPITRVVRLDRSGTTHVFKKYLNLINGTAFDTEKSESKTWGQLSEGAENTTWPKADAAVRPAASGGGALVAKVAETPSSIGYANLADARSNGKFSDTGVGGAGTAKFWAPVQRNGLGTENPKYEDPSTDGDSEPVANANCEGTKYTNGTETKFPPKLTSYPWNEVTTDTTEANYPICGLTYDMVLSKYSAYPVMTAGEATTANNLLAFILETEAGGGQQLIAGHDYELLPSTLLKEARKGAALAAF
jgi:ABC-type phosphate transport system substrate-binding protein